MKNIENEYFVPEAAKEHTTIRMNDTDFYYTDKGEKENFTLRKDKVIIKTKSEEDAKALCKQDVFLSAFDVSYIWVIATIDSLKTKIDDLLLMPNVIDATYALEYITGALLYPSNKISVKLKKEHSMEKVFNETGLTKIIETVELFFEDDDVYYITLNERMRNILYISRILFETGFCEFSAPSLIWEIQPGNTHYSDQWGLRNTGQNGGTYGIDIKAIEAWSITRGVNTIKVAVIDEGIDLMHPDLQGILDLSNGYDATVGAPSGANGSAKSTDGHGTACAGIIGAVNNSIGILGVASGVSIVPIRIGYLSGNSTSWTTSDAWAADGITKAWQTAEADVLNLSWGDLAWQPLTASAISNAVANGRKKDNISLQCVVVAASMNKNTDVYFPANMTNVIAVGSITNLGKRASNSNYGDNLDLVAPGVNIYTTGVQGDPRFNSVYINNEGYYFPTFSGTSAACPHVAGVAALILSVNPNLNMTQVRKAIESSCTKLPGYTYSTNSSHPYGTWNNEVGHGLVNAQAALVASIGASLTPSTSSKLFCSGTSFNVTLYNPYNLNLSWDYSYNVSLSPSGNPRTVTATSTNGPGYVSVKFGNGEVARYDNFWVNAPKFSSIQGPSSVPEMTATVYQAIYDSNSNPTPGTYQWSINPQGSSYMYVYDNIVYANFDSGYHQFLVRASNACGIGDYTVINVYAY